MLESERLLIKTEGYGYLVTKINSKEVEDYFHIRTQLECIGATLYLERATSADRARLKNHLKKAEAIYKKNNVRKIIESDTKFHDLMYQATKSEVFYRTISSLSDKTIIMRAAALQTDDGKEASLQDHLEIVRAIEKKDSRLLHEVIIEHMKYAPRYYEAIRPLISF